MANTAVVTGAGSGAGRAIAVALANAGWRVALVGRRSDALEATAKLASGNKPLVLPCDIQDAAAVGKMASAVLTEFKTVEVLVNAAGTNTPKRSLKELSTADFEKLMRTNLDGAYHCVQAFLPGMRAR